LVELVKTGRTEGEVKGRIRFPIPPVLVLRVSDSSRNDGLQVADMTTPEKGRKYLIGLSIGALGVVYGDIGTSPLYAFRECFNGPHKVDFTPENVLGVLSMIFWLLITLISVKYLGFVTRASNKGEGGTLSLMALAFPDRIRREARGLQAGLIMLGVFGAALLYGDGIITPAISVLSAVEGLKIAAPGLRPYVLPITIAIIILFFSFQRFGTGGVAKIFGPATLVWFITIGSLGLLKVIEVPGVLKAVSPHYALAFIASGPWEAFVVLGSAVLVVTGGEALYADMGHFGRKPMKVAWYAIVLPGLLLNYFGQGALVLQNPAAIEHPFYRLAPAWALYPLVGLATMATIIASQALISGAYSLTMQAIQLGYSPRMQIDHTSAQERGQIYMPKINWTLMIACIALVLGFQSSSNLASAYGVAVTATMVTTTVLFYPAARRLWKWEWWKAGALVVLFLSIELPLFTSNLLKVTHGGWFPLVVAVIVFTLMATWRTGRSILGNRLRAAVLPLGDFLKDIEAHPPHRVKGTAVFLSSNPNGTPLALMHNLKHNQVLHERVVILTIQTVEVPHVEPGERVEVEELSCGFHRIMGRFGFMEDPDVPQVFRACEAHGFKLETARTTYFLSRETIIASDRPGMFKWRERLFAFMSRNAQSATAFFRLPPNRVVELGMQVEI
jgi:KUP system potassium uptake protein